MRKEKAKFILNLSGRSVASALTGPVPTYRRGPNAAGSCFPTERGLDGEPTAIQTPVTARGGRQAPSALSHSATVHGAQSTAACDKHPVPALGIYPGIIGVLTGPASFQAVNISLDLFQSHSSRVPSHQLRTNRSDSLDPLSSNIISGPSRLGRLLAVTFSTPSHRQTTSIHIRVNLFASEE